MERLKKIVADSVFVFQILIAFIVVFESSISIPPVLQAVGRLHPALLHLPIGLFLVTVIFIFARKYFEGTSFNDLISFLLHFTALTASLTTIMGLLLALEHTFPADQLWVHKWLGVGLSFLCWILLGVRNKAAILKPLSAAGVVLLVLTGHYGASLTHGEDFVFAPLQSDEIRATRVITDSTALYTATIEPILETKCYGCHNDKKAKGKLILTSLENIAQGGKNGDVWKPHDAASSLIIKRILLPLEAKEHMPPKDKAQLTDDEVQFLTMWIDAGADTKIRLNELSETDTLKQLADLIIPRYIQPAGEKPLYTFEFAPQEKIEKLSTPNRTVFQIARNEPAVQADFYLRQTYQNKYLEELVEVKKQLISLNLSNMPVQDVDLKTIAKFENLEILNLNNTQIKGEGLKALTPLAKLKTLSLSGTDISQSALQEVGKNAALREVFIWNTPITDADQEALAKSFPRIRWDIGHKPDENEILKLNMPFIKNTTRVLAPDEKIILKHNLPGTEVRYTLDETDPDSLNSLVYSEAVNIERASTIKTRAYKDGWLSSDVAEFVFFKKGHKPSKVELITKPDDAYPGEGEITLVDEQKGLPDFYRHPAWMGFRKNDLIANFAFDDSTPAIRSVTLSYAKNIYAMCMPPQEMQIWAGIDSQNLKMIARVTPPQPTDYVATRIEGVTVTLPSARYKHYKVIAKPVAKLPAFRKTKKEETGWLMVDEIFFN